MSETADRWAAQPGPAKLLAAARDLLEEKRTGDRVTVHTQLTDTERAQVGRFLGLAWVTSGKPVALGALRAALARVDDTLDDLLVRLGGPLDDRPAQRARDTAATAAAVYAAYQILTTAGIPDHAVALARQRQWLGRPGGHELHDRAAALARLWASLPARPPQQSRTTRPLSEFANTEAGGTHNLDRDADLGRLASRLLAAAAAEPQQAATAADQALYAAPWREVWATYGIACDEVSSTVLVWNLRLAGTAAAAAITQAAAEYGEPVWLTARSLRGDWHPQPGTVTVRVCENPAVVETAANQLGATGQPVVCIYGRPSSAAWTLLRGLAAANVLLLITADRDNAGKRFLSELLELPNAEEWLPDVDGLHEEARLAQLIADLG